MSGRFILSAEAQFIAGWATVEVAQGKAHVTSLAFHILFGLGYVF